MCYYNSEKVSQLDYIRLMELEKQFGGLQIPDRPMQSGFDYGDWPVLKAVPGAKDFEVVKMEWGFIPFYLKTREAVQRFREGYKDEKGKFHPPIITLNAVGEELLFPNKMYREATLKRRCLVISSGFFEWRHHHPIGKKGLPLKTAAKYPYHISLKDRNYFFMAGIWQPWKDMETGEYVESFALVTTAANRLMEQVHNSKKRMPTILPEELAYEWLLGNLSEERITELATYRYPPEQMQACSIRKDFREAMEPTEPFSYEDLPGLVL